MITNPRVRGKQSKATGDRFEEIIADSLQYYRAAGIAAIEKTPEPFRIERSIGKGKFIGHYYKAAQPDFKGALSGGQAIAFDAKATLTDRIPVNALTETQQTDLLTYHRLGAKAGVLMCYSFKRFFFLPIDVFIGAKELNGHQWWTAEEAAKVTKEIPYRGILKIFQQEETNV